MEKDRYFQVLEQLEAEAAEEILILIFKPFADGQMVK